METISIDCLKQKHELFIQAKKQIINSWLFFQAVEDIFTKHGINKSYFLSRFAEGVLIIL